MASLQELLNAQNAAADRGRASAWSERNKQAFGGLLDINQYLPVTGDIQSGILAAQDVGQGEYGSAALNALGLLPFVPAMGGVVKNIKTVKPPKEDLYEVADSMFSYGIPFGNKTVDINSLTGAMSGSADDIAKVNKLAEQMQSPSGYIERLIIDDAGNVIEGQHRLNALRKIGIKKVPVSVIKNLSEPVESISEAGMRPENARQIMNNAVEMVKEAGSAEKAKQMFAIPKQYEKFYEIAFKNL